MDILAYLIGGGILLIWACIIGAVVVMCVLAHRADEQAERLLREPRSVTDGVDWKAEAKQSWERHCARRREVLR